MKIDISRFRQEKPESDLTRLNSNTIQLSVGLDFGTAFTKVVVRNIQNERSEVFVASDKFQDQEHGATMPFLIPSTVYCGVDENDIEWICRYFWETSTEMPLLKLALHEAWSEAKENTDTLTPFQAMAERTGEDIRGVAGLMTTFHLLSVLQEVANHFIQAYPETQKEIFVTMAIPVEDINNEETSQAFEECLNIAYSLTSWNHATNPLIYMTFAEFKTKVIAVDISKASDFCSLYPEVSANMVAHTRNRASREGLFQLVDVGAGTVDISFFSFLRNDGEPRLNNFVGKIDFCGSSKIERLAYYKMPEEHRCILTLLHSKEGSGDDYDETYHLAIKESAQDLIDPVASLAHTSRLEMRSKLPSPRQLHETIVIFVGGGAQKTPYHDGIEQDWSHTNHPGLEFTDVTPPTDLELKEPVWFRRLTVAYGLSIEPINRPNVSIPIEHSPIPSDIQNKPKPMVTSAPSKDEC
jgi:hypothetical protein